MPLTRMSREILLMSSRRGTKSTWSVKPAVTGQKVVNAIWNVENFNQIESKGFFAALLRFFVWFSLFGWGFCHKDG